MLIRLEQTAGKIKLDKQKKSEKKQKEIYV